MPVELDLNRARGVREIPQNECAGSVRSSSQRAHVVSRSCPEVDLGEHEQRCVAVHRIGERAAFDHAHLTAEEVRDTTGDVEIGGEIAPLGEDHAASWARAQDRGHQPEQPHRRGVRNEHLTRRSAKELSDAIADSHR